MSKMKRIIFLLAMCFLLSIGGIAQASEEHDMRWIDLQNITGLNKQPDNDKKAYGYFVDLNKKEGGNTSFFVECDPLSGQPTGKAYYNIQHEVNSEEQTLAGYIKGKVEDWGKIKKISPLEINLIAPNIKTSLNNDWSTGGVSKIAQGSVQWPGTTQSYLIPGSNPDYWLIVAEVSNPNDFPVKADLNASISRWRDNLAGYSRSSGDLSKSLNNFQVGAGETKFVLINRGKKANVLGEDLDWNSTTSMDSWAEAYYNINVTENDDPQLPDDLKPNKGYITFQNFSGSAPVPVSLSNGIPPNTPTSGGPYVNHYDASGPALVDYECGEDYNLNARVFSIDDPWLIGWTNNVPVLKYHPIFVELYHFEPTDGDDVGKLVKEVKPGYNIYASSITRPYISIHDAYEGYNITEGKSGKNYYYDININHKVTINAINKEGDVSTSFSNLNVGLPNVYFGSSQFYSKLSNYYDAAIGVSPSYKDSDSLPVLNIGNVTLNGGESKTIYDKEMTSTIRVWEKFGQNSDPRYVSSKTINSIAPEIFPNYFNWDGEGCIDYNTKISFTPVYGDILSLNSALGKHKVNHDYNYDDMGIKSSKWLAPLSYFNHDGLNLLASDEVWAELQQQRTLSCRAGVSNNDQWRLQSNFWPTMLYTSSGKYKGWNISLSY